MKTSRLITTVETHTAGEPFRIITSGAPRVPGKTILERGAWLQENGDEIRRAMMLEPRGHGDMYGGLLTEPVSDGADLRHHIHAERRLQPPLRARRHRAGDRCRGAWLGRTGIS